MANLDIQGEFNFPKEKIRSEIIELIHHRLEYIKEEKENIRKDLQKWHETYQISDLNFLKLFETKKLDDQEDFFLWKATLKLLIELNEEELMLKDLT